MLCQRFNVEHRRPAGGSSKRRARTSSNNLSSQRQPSPAATASALPMNLDMAVTHIEQEVVIEGLLHVTAVQAGSCMAQFGELGSPVSAPPVQSLRSALADDSQSNRIVSKAICLATPPDAPDEPQQRLVMQARRTALQCEEASNLVELQTWQRTALLEFYSAQVLRAAAAVRRQRRKKLLRALRASRDVTQALLAGPAAVLGSLTSRDEAD